MSSVAAQPVASSAALPALDTILGWLDQVMDPELPVVSVVDLGIVRDACWQVDGADADATTLVVTLTPTYSGCPAAEVIAESIRQCLHAHGVERIELRTRLAPAWSTDWMSAKGRQALRGYGIAPPIGRARDAAPDQVIDIGALLPVRVAVPCPLCGTARTRLVSQFGSTASKALYQCRDCLEPFDYFKPH